MSTDPIDVDELRDLMSAAGVLPPLPPALTADVASRESLLEHILAEARAGDRALADTDAPVTALAPARRRMRDRSRRRLATLAAAGSLALVTVLGTQLSSGPEAVASSPALLAFSEADALDVMTGRAPSARATLTTLAAAALAAPAVQAGGDVQRVATYAWLFVQDGDTGTISTVPTQSVWWAAPDGAIRSTQSRTGAITQDGQIDPTASALSEPTASTDSFPAGSLVPSTLDALPRETTALTTELLTLVGGEMCMGDPVTQASCLATAVQQLFSQYVVPGDLAAALWSTLAEQPAVVDLGSTTDRFGRPGTAVAIAPAPGAPEAVTVLIISPADGQLLGVETITVSDPGVSGSLAGFTVWNPSAWVPALGD